MKGDLKHVDLTSKDIQEDSCHFTVGEQEFERLLNGIWGGSAIQILMKEPQIIACILPANVEEIGRVPSIQL
jgi:hypothetical protein